MRSKPPDDRDLLREKIIGLGEASLHKSYYPELQSRLAELERFRALLDQTHDAIFLIRTETGKLADVNASAGAYLGYSKEELVAIPFADLLSPQQSARFVDLVRKKSDHPSGSRQTCIASLLSRGGVEIPVEITVRSVTFDGEPYIVAIARDITNRIFAEKELKIKESALESSINGILIADLTGTIMYANPGFASIFGYERGEAITGRNMDAFFVDPTFGGEITVHILDSNAIMKETIGLRNDRSPFHIQVSGSVVQNDAGQPLCIMLIVMDITERILADQMKREAYAQLEKNIEQFAILGDHIRNSLQVIVGYAEMIDDPLIRKILDQSGRIDEIVTQLDQGWMESTNVRRFLRRRGGDADPPAETLARSSAAKEEDS
ncbi:MULTISPECIES: PAS domain S-box protein [unclassified Methanoculleus]|uniref:PAS domain-containing protein n=1 Tax=unclassified Methanoculleus TaxID=2619537 RepID=UPI0025EB233E|nr:MULTISPECIES: PAS domain S-box protein [unclassified Methanoculleus]MCK9318488.1 PAS domain S-box protein [Methanoculleus sp.]MDD2254352.1 PAS domain S-box protein [Methanoculleus sp.]MDD2788791.1 PAS domain S-box protein [Methanoculleus sp.]MDD3216713.1 PAS domain S-box protein [Methanoculleus sp.]MDD4313606.1 PAS domain S-box protein [Methanoculleus sp.]